MTPPCFSVLSAYACAPPVSHCQAAGALQKYQVQAVVANLLHTRKDRVLVVRPHQQPDTSCPVAAGDQQVQVMEVLRPPHEPHIESQLVARVVLLHQEFLQQQGLQRNS